MAENTETKYPITAELLKGLTGHTFGDSECEMINMAIDADTCVHNAEYFKQRSEQKEIQVIEKFKEYERLKTKRKNYGTTGKKADCVIPAGKKERNNTGLQWKH